MKKIGISVNVLSVLIWIFYFIMVLPNAVTRSSPDIQSSSASVLIVASILAAVGICIGIYLVKKSKPKT